MAGTRVTPCPAMRWCVTSARSSSKAGRNDVRFTDVAGLIDPTTVSFESLTDPTGTRVVEQNFQFDLVSTDKLLQEVHRPRDHGRADPRREGGHLHRHAALHGWRAGSARGDGSVRVVSHNSGITLPSVPGGLITRPTLLWDVATKKPGKHLARVVYQTTGITWWADYNLTYSEGADANSCKLNVGAWVSILNQSGASYPEAKIKLIAGRRAPRSTAGDAAGVGESHARRSDDGRGARLREKTFFEYHLYTLGRPSSLPDNSTKQIELFPAAAGVACDKTLVYYGQAGMYAGYGGSPTRTATTGW